MFKDKRSPYDLSLKLKVIEAILKGKLTHSQARKRYGIKGHDTIPRWIRYYQLEMYQQRGLPMASDDANKSRKELLAELRQAKMENAILNAYMEITKEEELAASLEKKMVSDHREADE